MSSRILQAAFPLVRQYGFTRQTLALAGQACPSHTEAQANPEPLSDSAITALFGKGDEARRTLIRAWLDEGKRSMANIHDKNSVSDILKSRLQYNTPALPYLPEAFALMASPTLGVPPFDPRPALSHAAGIADQACRVMDDHTPGAAWYTRRASLATIYATAELHQMTSPETAYEFLDTLIAASDTLGSAVDEIGLFAQSIGRSWSGIIRSSGVL